MQEREMNFFDLCVACWRGIKRACCACGNLVASMVRITYRMWWIVLPVLIIALSWANYHARKSNRVYKAEALVWLNGPSIELTEQVYKNLLYATSPEISSKQNILAQLDVDPAYLDGISDFETFYVIDCMHDSVADRIDYRHRANLTDTVNVRMPNRLCLRFLTRQPDNINIVGEGIVDYLNRNPQMQTAYEHKRAILEREVKFAKDQVEKLDSLTSAFYFKQGTGQQAQVDLWDRGFVMGRREIKLFTNAVYNEFGRYTSLDYALAFCTAPVVIEDQFKIIPVAVNNRKKMNAIGLVFGWIIGCILAALVENRKSILAWLKK